jgi:hypothetical protein
MRTSSPVPNYFQSNKYMTVGQTIRRSVWRGATRHLGRGVLSRTLEYYKMNATDRKNLLNSYNKYINALNNSSARMARANAERAATKFVNTMFKIYEKKVNVRSGPSPVANGITNGVRKSLVYWIPGVVYRHATRPKKKYKSATVRRSRTTV